MNNGKILTFRLPTALHRRLVEQAATEGTTISDIARNIILEHKQIEGITAKIDELEIGRRFRELYAQARIANHGIDALARLTLGDNNYEQWRSAISQGLEQETAKARSGEVMTR